MGNYSDFINLSECAPCGKGQKLHNEFLDAFKMSDRRSSCQLE